MTLGVPSVGGFIKTAIHSPNQHRGAFREFPVDDERVSPHKHRIADYRGPKHRRCCCSGFLQAYPFSWSAIRLATGCFAHNFRFTLETSDSLISEVSRKLARKLKEEKKRLSETKSPT